MHVRFARLLVVASLAIGVAIGRGTAPSQCIASSGDERDRYLTRRLQAEITDASDTSKKEWRPPRKRAPPHATRRRGHPRRDDGDLEGIRAALDFSTLMGKMKTTPRSGWVYYRVKSRVESIADHTFRVALMSMVAAHHHRRPPPSSSSVATPAPAQTAPAAATVDWQRCVVLALVHDVAEAIVGDITPLDGIPHEVKEEREGEAMERIRAILSPWSAVAGEALYAAWREYEEGDTAEAKLVKDMDKVELMLQAAEIENDGDEDGGHGGGNDGDGDGDGDGDEVGGVAEDGDGGPRGGAKNKRNKMMPAGRASSSSPSSSPSSPSFSPSSSPSSSSPYVLTDFYTLALTRLKTRTGRKWAQEVLRRRPEGARVGWEEKPEVEGERGGWAEAIRRLARALKGSAPMVVPDLNRVNLTHLTRRNAPYHTS